MSYMYCDNCGEYSEEWEYNDECPYCGNMRYTDTYSSYDESVYYRPRNDYNVRNNNNDENNDAKWLLGCCCCCFGALIFMFIFSV